MQQYAQQLNQLSNPTFQQIRNIAGNSISHLTDPERSSLWDNLNRGVSLLDSHELLCLYLHAYGNMHQAKLLDAFKQLPHQLISQPFELFDWGCGQAMATVNFFDFLKEKNFEKNVKRITLIEPSKAALERGVLHTSKYITDQVPLISINDFFENVSPHQLQSDEALPQIHVFSNILDVAQIDLKHLATLIDSSIKSDSYLVCVGPLNPTNKRIDAFLKYFKEDALESIYSFEDYNYLSGFMRRPKTCKLKVYKLLSNQEGHLIPIEYFPPVQFQAAYELDVVKASRKSQDILPNEKLIYFEVAAPFDLGASVYDDVHPVLAVTNNIITRGLPTKASTYIEEEFVRAFGLTNKSVEYGEINYEGENLFETEDLQKLFLSTLDQELTISDEDTMKLQLILTPVAIARFQKVLLEAIITGHLSLEKKNWKILVEEEDVPFASLAIKDFQDLIFHLTQLSEIYQDFQLPQIDLIIISNSIFINSPLHLGIKIHTNADSWLRKQQYDLVVTQSVLKSVSKKIDAFSKYDCINYCYFNIRTITKSRTERIIYTSDRIKYQSLVKKDQQGNYIEIEKSKAHLTYFLQLLFRKASFRSGQLPILDRALKNQPVIGLLPTGGGKSLTYQIAALLQPGVTLVIDPLKSLMKDQYDGLVKNGIDCCSFINSTLTPEERGVREKQLEGSQLLYVFLSPERLSIAEFRERLKNMHDHNVYFSYGVIDEVHCVSEWGHDFRFSYLHLGRNLYNYVKAKNGIISLFGLTATASFDVLADVERELSGNGSFDLDSDAIIRYENTNRLELQYKIEKVPVTFDVDEFYDKNGNMPHHLPKAINILRNQSQYNSKSIFIQDYIYKIPAFFREIQENKNLQNIKNKFLERQNLKDVIDQELNVNMPDDFCHKNTTYNQAGIIFCPHVNNTGVSVNVNAQKIRTNGVKDVGSFSGKDNDHLSMVNLENFRENRLPLMFATKAFGMGIDKPNVRFTINMNYSSSLEAFVQEAGRAGRDRKMALATIILSDYTLASINKSYQQNQFPLGIIKNKWFLKEDLRRILDFYNLVIPEEHLLYATPTLDIVRLHCRIDNRTFGFNNCASGCDKFSGCDLAKVNSEAKGWKTEKELVQELRKQNLKLSKQNFQYLNADYQVPMYFFNNSFKGDVIEKKYMFRLLKHIKVDIRLEDDDNILQSGTGFIEILKQLNIGERAIVNIPYINEDEIGEDVDENDTTINRVTDLNKAIYRMCCIELIDDFTQDYKNQRFRIIVTRKEKGEYFNGLKRFLLRYYTDNRAEIEIQKATEFSLKDGQYHEIEEEVYKCLAYLTEFVYNKISEKRKRAIDDMRNFCLEGLDENDTWLEANEKLKDFLYYYFNSKYAKKDYVTENGEPFSLLEDTEEGKKSDSAILFKYLRVIDDDVVGFSTPLDNVKHLYGAVRLISRSLTDSNPTLALLEAFCLAYMGTRSNENLEIQLYSRYTEGLLEESIRSSSQIDFWQLFEKYNEALNEYIESNDFLKLKEEAFILIHTKQATKLINKYIN